jgi:2-dehydro-3-deoxyphosphooctonate aldolase (KDO 8-P synthase)
MMDLGGHRLDNENLFFVLGPCVIESEELTLHVAREVARISSVAGVPVVFKASFDKANRTSLESYRGPGLKTGLEILKRVRETTGLPVVSDIHTPDQAPLAGEVLDMIQIPAFLSRQTDLLTAAGRTGRVVNIKKGQFQAPEDIQYAVKKVLSTGNSNILLTERGSSFGYQDLVADMRSIPRMKSFGFPVIFDATHSAQFPGSGDGCTGGNRSLVAPLARAAVAAGADGVFMEIHPDPDHALCDGPNSLALTDVEALVLNLRDIHRLIPASSSNNLDPLAVPSGLTSSDSVEDLQIVDKELALLADSKCETSRDSLEEDLKKVRLIIFDVDGVLTDGGIIFGTGGLEIKSFNVRDGHGIKIAKRCGLDIALVTGRTSEVVHRRAQDLGIERVYQGVWDKKPVLAQLMTELNLTSDQVAVMGDDIVDIPLMRRAGVGFTVPEAPEEVRREAAYVTRYGGGRGAAREMVEIVLKAQGKWEAAMTRYYE